MLAYDYPLISLVWLIAWWFFVFTIFFGVIWAFIDNFRRHDHSGWAKAGWALLILILPLFGMLIYLIRATSTGRRNRLKSADGVHRSEGERRARRLAEECSVLAREAAEMPEPKVGGGPGDGVARRRALDERAAHLVERRDA